MVGLNSDASVKRLKGESRPTQTEARAAVLSSLETVDLVIIFEEDTPERLLHEIKPDVLVKGADYTIETVVGADFVKGYGGEVVLAEIVPGFSTTATIARMNAPDRVVATILENLFYALSWVLFGAVHSVLAESVKRRLSPSGANGRWRPGQNG